MAKTKYSYETKEQDTPTDYTDQCINFGISSTLNF